MLFLFINRYTSGKQLAKLLVIMYLSYNEFVCTLSKVTSATSVTDQKYYDIHIIDNLICGKRGIGTSFQIR